MPKSSVNNNKGISVIRSNTVDMCMTYALI